jgi:hypothetical protein
LALLDSTRLIKLNNKGENMSAKLKIIVLTFVIMAVIASSAFGAPIMPREVISKPPPAVAITPTPPPPLNKVAMNSKQFQYAGGNFQAGLATTFQGAITVDITRRPPPVPSAPAPVDMYLRNETTGQTSAAVRITPLAGRLTYTPTSTDLQRGAAVYSVIVNSSTPNGTISISYPKPDEARLDAYLMSLTPQQRSALQTALAKPAAIIPPPPRTAAQANVCDQAAVTAMLSPKSIPVGSPDRCFGATGRACASQLLGEINVIGQKPEFVTSLNHDCSVNERVSVGSIFHDNCCALPQNVNGMYCSGDLLFNFTEKDKLFQDSGHACHREWRKAVYDVLENRSWPERFGPYYTNGNFDAYGPSETARRGYTYGPMGVQDKPRQYSGSEYQATKRLQAPMNQKLEWGDNEFCKSRRFKEEHWCAPVLGCSNIAELSAAKKKLKDAIDNKWWDADPRKIAITTELGLIEKKYNLRNQHWGICE